jgi:acylaminoacyl-peptidase
MPIAFMAASGYTAILVQFRGSLGFGEDNVQSLPGNVGVNDVEDCVAALDAAVAEGALVGASITNLYFIANKF